MSSRYLCVIIAGVLLCGAAAAAGAPPTRLERRSRALNSVAPWRSLQETFLFTVNYVAQFQVFQGAQCVSDNPPMLRMYCIGPHLQVLATSSPFVVCEPPTLDDYDRSYAECTTTCTSETECDDVYRQIDAFANVTFTCAGDTMAEVDGYAEFMPGTGTCAEDELLFHMIRMGASCPTSVARPTGMVAPDTDRQYVLDDYFFECRGRGAFSLSPLTDDEEAVPGDYYRCAGGTSCSNGTSCDIVIDSVYVNADVPLLWEEGCIERSDAATDDAVVAIPATNATWTNSPLLITAQFVAYWGYLFDPLSSCTGVDNPVITISCEGSTLTLLDATDSIECTKVTDDTMECLGNKTTRTLGFLSNVQYECMGPALTHSSVQFPEGEASCNGNTAESTVSQGVQMAVSCQDSTTGEDFLYYGDLAFDCTSADAFFDYYDEFADPFGGDESSFAKEDTLKRYTCFRTTTFATGSTTAQMIPAVGISTDLAWLAVPDETCFTTASNPQYEPPPETPSPTVPAATLFPTPAVTLGPTTVAPTASPTAAPVERTSAPLTVAVPTVAPVTLAPVAVPTAPVMVAPVTGAAPVAVAAPVMARDSTSSDNSDTVLIGAAVGGASVAVIVAGLVVFWVLRRKSTDSDNDPHVTKPPVGSTIYTGATSLDHNSAAPSNTSQRVDSNATPYYREGATETSETEVDLPPSYPSSSHNDSSGYPSTDFAPSNYAASAQTHASSNYAGTATASHFNSHVPSSRTALRPRMSGEDLQYKDQARSVVAVPMVEPIHEDTDEPIVAPAMATVTLDASAVSAKTHGSSDSSKQRRAALDP